MLILLLVVALHVGLSAVVGRILRRSVDLSEPWASLFSYSVLTVFLLAMVANISMTYRFAPGVVEWVAGRESADEAHTMVAFLVSCPFAVLVTYLWYRVALTVNRAWVRRSVEKSRIGS